MSEHKTIPQHLDDPGIDMELDRPMIQPLSMPVKSPIKIPRTSRLTVVSTVSHQIPGRQPTGYPGKYCCNLSSQEQVYERFNVIGEKWQPLDTGWVKECALMILTNEEGKFTQTVPSEEEKEQAKELVIEIGMMDHHGVEVDPFGIISCGRFLYLQPENLERLRIRSRSGDIKYTLTLIPL